MNTDTLQHCRDRLRAELTNTIAERRAAMLDTIGQRLAHVRSCAGERQDVWAARLGITLRTWQNYEQGHTSPNAYALTTLYRLGINPTWVLTGTGTVLMDAPRPADKLDRERMATAIEATAEGLKNIQRTLSPKLYAQLALAAYDLIGKEC